MENFIIALILAVLIIIGLNATKKHFKGEGGCCGGGSSVKPRKKKLNNVIEKKTVKIEGMTCENCQYRVERAINEIDGASASVHLRRGEAVISMERHITDEEIRAVIEKAGYKML